MTKGKQIGLYLLLVVTLGLLLALLIPSFWRDCVTSATSARQNIHYTQGAVSSEGETAAAGRQGDTWRLVRGEGGHRTDSDTLAGLGITDVVTVDELYVCAGGGVALAVYEQKENLQCSVYYIPPGEGTAQLMVRAHCTGGLRGDVRFFGFAEEGGAVSFLQGGLTGAVYCYEPGAESAQKLGDLPNTREVLFAMPDGSVGTVTGAALSIPPYSVPLPAETLPAAGWRVIDGACLLDSREGALWRIDEDNGRAERLLVLDETAPEVIDVTISHDGRVALLTDGGDLLIWRDGAVQECTKLLYRAQWQSILILALAVVGTLALALALWYVLWGLRKMQLSLVLRVGGAMATALVLLTAAAVHFVVNPHYEDHADQLAQRFLRIEGERADIWSTGVERMFLDRTGETLTWQGQNLTVLMRGAAFRQGAETALAEGMAFTRYTDGGIDYYGRFTRVTDQQAVVVSTECAPYLLMGEEASAMSVRLLWCSAALALALTFLSLAALTRRMRKVSSAMAALDRGDTHIEVVDNGGDEISALADGVNTLAKNRQASHAYEDQRGDLFTRFLPGQILTLMDVPSVAEINKQTFASRRMTTMHVSISFEEQVYESRSEELFDNINEVTERASRVVSAQGGSIFSFSHAGFEALFAPDSNAAISAAVAIRQEIISLNRERYRRNRSPVTLRIALDSGDVMLGVVGDESRMQPTAVSSSFNTTRMLDGLFARFEANILCTERIERWAGGYGSRYVGKTHDGDEFIRVYEIYDGDPYLTRQRKAEMGTQFAEGVYTLYAGEYASAKRIFMEIVRLNSSDGAARFYLYLADRFEKEPPAEVSLDF